MSEVRRRIAIASDHLEDDIVWGPPSWGPTPVGDKTHRKRLLAQVVTQQGDDRDERIRQAETKAEAAIETVRVMATWMAKTEADRRCAVARRLARLEKLVPHIDRASGGASFPRLEVTPETMAAIFGEDE